MKKTWLLSLTALLPAYTSAHGLTLSIDNDGIFGSDKDYSSGLYLDYYQRLESSPLALLSTSDARHYWGIRLGQQILTPDDIESPVPIEGQRPYAGLSYLEGRLVTITSDKFAAVEVMLGTMGENSLAHDGQSIIHSIIGSPDPKGWAYQIEEPAVYGVTGHYFSKLYRENNTELSWQSRAQLGNYQPEIATGLMGRSGEYLDQSYGSNHIRYYAPTSSLYMDGPASGWYWFAGAEIRYRFADLTLGGNTSKPIPRVDVQHLQATAVAGVQFLFGDNWGIGFSAAVKSPDFRQDEAIAHAAGSVSLNWRF